MVVPSRRDRSRPLRRHREQRLAYFFELRRMEKPRGERLHVTGNLMGIGTAMGEDHDRHPQIAGFDRDRQSVTRDLEVEQDRGRPRPEGPQRFADGGYLRGDRPTRTEYRGEERSQLRMIGHDQHLKTLQQLIEHERWRVQPQCRRVAHPAEASVGARSGRG
jgi:hypothetical protein